MENKYDNGKIYQIWNEMTDDIYVGSTYDMLCKRMDKHRSAHSKEKYNQRKLYKLMNEVGVGHFHIELIELYPCSCKDELRKREGHFIRQIGTLNMTIEDRTRQEYNEQHKEQRAIYMETYRDKNKDRINETSKEYRDNNHDKIKQYKIDNKEHILAQNKDYYQRTKEQLKITTKVKEWKNTKVACPCGGSYTLCHKAAHFKCARHLKHEILLQKQI